MTVASSVGWDGTSASDIFLRRTVSHFFTEKGIRFCNLLHNSPVALGLLGTIPGLVGPAVSDHINEECQSIFYSERANIFSNPLGDSPVIPELSSTVDSSVVHSPKDLPKFLSSSSELFNVADSSSPAQPLCID